EDGIKSLEDFAGCVPDDLVGWYETVDGEQMRHEGTLKAFRMSASQAEEMIMASRVKAGWIEEADLAPEVAEGAGEGADPAEGETDATSAPDPAS
ncbi:MAG: transcription termination factor NusA, partial [Alphaproteobacteria bacterium]